MRDYLGAAFILVWLLTAAQTQVRAESVEGGTARIEAASDQRVIDLNQAARLLQDKGKFEAAENLFKQSISLDPTNIHSLIGIAQLYTKLGDRPKGLAYLDAARRQEPVKPDEELFIARGYADAKRYDIARAHFETAIAAAQKMRDKLLEARIYIDWGATFSNQKQFRDAEERFTDAYQLLDSLKPSASVQREWRRWLSAAADYEIARGALNEAVDALAELANQLQEANDHLAIAQVSHRLGKVLRDQNAMERAEKYLTIAAGLFRELLGADHPDTIGAENDLIELQRSAA